MVMLDPTCTASQRNTEAPKAMRTIPNKARCQHTRASLLLPEGYARFADEAIGRRGFRLLTCLERLTPAITQQLICDQDAPPPFGDQQQVEEISLRP